MPHYATLRDYRFDADEHDIRGARLYGEGAEELARIKDVVFDHNSGDIQYLVAEYGHDRRVLVPLDRVFRSTVDEDSFSSDMTCDDLDHLPAFDEHMLDDRKQWHDYEQLHRTTMEDIRKRAEQEYKRDWKDDPVQHMDGDVAHNITPVEPVPAPARERSNVTSIDRDRRDDYTPDLTPNRLAPVFTQTNQTGDKLTMVPNASGSRGAAAEYVTAGLGPKWNGFQERVRRDLHHIRGGCRMCEDEGTRAA